MVSRTRLAMLSEWVNWYFETREACAHYRKSVLHRATQLEEWCGRTLDIADLDDSLINRWVIHLQEEGRLSPKTIKDYREAVLQVWRAAYEEGLVEHMPRRIRKIRVPRQTPTGWHLPELAKLLEACNHLPGTVKGTSIPRGLWFRGHFQVLWDTGLRRADGIAVRRSDLRPGGIIYVRQSKTGEPLARRLGDDTLATLERIREAGQLGDDDPLTPWPGSWRQYEHWLRWLVARAEIRPGGTRRIRIASASYIERDHPGEARNHLGHKTPGLAEAHYLDPSIVEREIHLPPRISDSA